MSDDANTQTKASPFPPCTDSERTKQVSSVSWTASVFVIFASIILINVPTWPAAFGVAALAVMITIICGFILKR